MQPTGTLSPPVPNLSLVHAVWKECAIRGTCIVRAKTVAVSCSFRIAMIAARGIAMRYFISATAAGAWGRSAAATSTWARSINIDGPGDLLIAKALIESGLVGAETQRG